MKVTIVDFYKEVTGATTAHVATPVARRALDRWQIPYDTTTPKGALKRFWKVDIAHLGPAKTLYEIEDKEAKERKNKAKAKPPKDEQINPAYSIMERMAAVEQELRTLNTQLTAFIAKFG